MVCIRSARNSLLIATIIGFIGVAGLLLLAGLLFLLSTDKVQPIWLGAISVLILVNCWGGLMQARALARVAKLPRREGFACPNCKAVPPQGALWVCGKCRKPFDTFATQGVCPHCSTQYTATSCPECGSMRPFSEWMTPTNVPPQI